MDRLAAAEDGTVERREEWVTDPRRFAELRDPWNRLATDNLFMAWDWLDCWWRAFGQEAEMRVHASWDGSELVGGMALGLRGGHLSAMADEQTDLYRPVARSGYDERFAYFAPGNVLRLEMIERCFQEELVAQELLGPMLRWKERFATESRDTSVLRAYRRRPGPLARYGGRRLALPWLRAAYLGSRRIGDRLRGRRGAAPAQGDDA